MKSKSLAPGDSIRVKPTVHDPDFGTDLGGWQGRVVKVYARAKPPTVEIEWDSLTLAAMPSAQIAQCETDGLEWRRMVLALDEVEPAPARDAAGDVSRQAQHMQRQHAWEWLGESGRRIQQVLAGIDPADIMALLRAWQACLLANWPLPCDAVVDEDHSHGPLHVGDRVKVLGFSAVDDLYGLIVHVRLGRRQYDYPLCDLKVSAQASPAHQLIDDYRTWHANQ
jgi:hypothetical protein